MSTPLIQDLMAATKDLRQVNPCPGLLRFSCLGASFLALVHLSWMANSPISFVSYTVLAGILYSFWLICTHDAAHHTLTGWVWFDEAVARLISWPMLWPFGVYSELHRLHHSWNSRDLRDPERVQWTVLEYNKAAPLLRWYIHHQWWIDIFGLGGMGMIAKILWQGLKLKPSAPRLQRQLFWDGAGIVIVQGSLVTLTLALHHSLWRYLLFWLILERTIGIGMQTRDHLEHYGLWMPGGQHLTTQLYAGRNLRVWPGMGWLLGGLHYHGVHHAFPGVPFYRLPAAFQRVQAILLRHQQPAMVVDAGYIKTALHLGRQSSCITRAGTAKGFKISPAP
jgi:fatty acid desaturase